MAFFFSFSTSSCSFGNRRLISTKNSDEADVFPSRLCLTPERRTCLFTKYLVALGNWILRLTIITGTNMAETPVIIVHGGAWAIPDSLEVDSQEGVKTAARIGHDILRSGGSAVDAVEAAVRSLEDNWVFDAGYGSVLTADGTIETDAMVMDGSDLSAGSVAAVRGIRNPVSLARRVMQESDHTMMVGEGAVKMATEVFGMETVEEKELMVPMNVEAWEKYMKYRDVVQDQFRQCTNGHDTVGAVALDSNGHIAAATSTGGITGKRPGRVGDSPLIGCGGYADDDVGGVSTTGHGESITKVCLAYSIINQLRQGKDPKSANDFELKRMYRRVGGSGGVITIKRLTGEFMASFSTERMPWAAIKGGTVRFGINPGENHEEDI